ncbi:MAG: PD40 domain-containing protein [Phycisphaerales bacterium]|nr:PD40 domain-containing protein [Phycisphaerales bacterium]
MKLALRTATVVAGFACFVSLAAADAVVFARDLALSPDGRSLAFSWAGDIWSVPVDGGDARRLTAHPADETTPVWSPDGRTIAFASTRNGAANLFTMTADGQNVTRVTYGDRGETPSAFSPDGGYLYFHMRRDGSMRFEPMLYRVPVGGGQVWRVLECYGSGARPSPDGKYLAFTRGWSPFSRTGYRGSANHDIWLYEPATARFSQLTDFSGTDLWPSWAPDTSGVYMISDRPFTPASGPQPDPRGVMNVWFQPLDGAARQITFATTDRVRDFSVSADGRTLAYTQWDRIFVVDLAAAGANPTPESLRPREIRVDAASDTPGKPVELRTLSRDADEVEASPDGKEIALVVRGEIFVIKTEAEKPTRRVTDSPSRERDVTWSPDGKALYFVSDRDGHEQVYRALSAETPAKPLSDSLRFKIERVSDSPEIERSPLISPDGKSLAVVRERGNVVIRDLETGSERVVFESFDRPAVRWSPDSRWLAYSVEDDEFNPDVWIAPADGSAAAVNISQHPDADGNPQWSADGQVLAFSSRREGQDSDIYMVFLSPALDEKSSVDLAEYFEKAAEKVKKRKPLGECVASGTIHLGAAPASQPASGPARKPAKSGKKPEKGDWRSRIRKAVQEFLKEDEKKSADKSDKADKDKKEPEVEYKYDLASAYRRLRRVTSPPASKTAFALSPDGQTIAYLANNEGSPALYTIKWNGQDRKKAVTGGLGGLHWALDQSRLFYLKSGVPGSCKGDGGDAKDHAFSAKLRIDVAAEAAQKFRDGARTMGLTFYHPTLKGLDWPALTAKYEALATRVRTAREFNQIFDFFQGELNASHLGVSGPRGGDGGGPAESVGYLGVDFDPAFGGPGLKVLSVVKDSPADRDESRLTVGDVVLKVNGTPVGPDSSIDAALLMTVGEQVILEIAPSPGRAAASRPASGPAASGPAAADEPASAPATAAASAPARLEVIIRPIGGGAYSELRYEAWVRENTRYVAEKSGGRVAYTHISGMGEPQFYTFERDLYAVASGRDGLIIDVRNNGGGWTADWVMAVLNARRHAYTIPRGGRRGYPQDRLIFYSWPKAAVMMCNQYSYSNAEIVSHAFKTLGRGPLVGMTTFGAVISTGAFQLIDGTTIRQPFRGWYLPDGTDMEDKGAEPNIIVAETPDDEQNGRRPQLDAAIRAALEEGARGGR